MKTLATALAVLLATATTACAAPAPGNMLIGTWKLDPATNPSAYCQQPLNFTPTSFTKPEIAGGTSTIPVTYIPGQTQTFPTTVYMVMSNATHLTYVFKSPDRMVLDTYMQCTYVRG